MSNSDDYYSRRVRCSDDPFWQVGKTVGGKPVDEKQLDLIVGQVRHTLDLHGTDRVADLGCGNGLVTREVSRFVASTLGVEKNKDLYDAALKLCSSCHVELYNESILEFDFSASGANKLYLYEVVQHLGYREVAETVLRIARSVGAGSRIFIGGIPDDERKWDFYGPWQRRRSYMEALALGTDVMGTWFHKDFFLFLGEQYGLDVEILQQHSDLYTSSYRFDCLIRV